MPRELHGELESRRHDANDGVTFVVEGEMLADGLWPATEIPLPRAIADDDHVGRARGAVSRIECAAMKRSNAQRWKQ